MDYTLQHIIEKHRNQEKVAFLFFWGHTVKEELSKSCFSQWFPVSFKENGIEYKTAEHYMMAGKARLFEDENILEKILQCKTPNEVKSLGRKVKNFDPQLWNEHKYEIVKQGNLLKFSQNPKLRNFLMATENQILVEASPYDRIWGIGMLESDSRAQDPALWDGENLLGFALMEVRDELRK